MLLDAESRIGEILGETEHRGGSNREGTSHPLPEGEILKENPPTSVRDEAGKLRGIVMATKPDYKDAGGQ